MKTFIIIVLILIAFYVLYALTLKEKHINLDCLNVENYMLIKESPEADDLCKYELHREENQIRFTRKNIDYTLFLLLLKEENGETHVKLRGLDGYGIRDREFLKSVCNLVAKIKENKLENNKS